MHFAIGMLQYRVVLRGKMNRHEAKFMMEKLLECQQALDRALEFSEQLHVKGESEALASTIKNVIGEILTEAIMPIASQHPDMNPYEKN